MLFHLPSLCALSVNLSHTEAQCVGRVLVYGRVQVETKQQIRFHFQKGCNYESVQLRGYDKKEPL